MNAALERIILRVLSDAHPLMKRERTLLADVQVESDEAVTKATFLKSMSDLENKQGGAQVVGVQTEDGTKWKITAEGLARLAGA